MRPASHGNKTGIRPSEHIDTGIPKQCKSRLGQIKRRYFVKYPMTTAPGIPIAKLS